MEIGKSLTSASRLPGGVRSSYRPARFQRRGVPIGSCPANRRKGPPYSLAHSKLLARRVKATLGVHGVVVRMDRVMRAARMILVALQHSFGNGSRA